MRSVLDEEINQHYSYQTDLTYFKRKTCLILFYDLDFFVS